MVVFLDANQNEVEKPKDKIIRWRISGYVLIQSEEEKILMVTPTWNNLWELPGGQIELLEGLPEGIARECYEETGYKVKVDPHSAIHVGESYFYNRATNEFCHSIILVFPGILINKKQDLHVVNSFGENEIEKIEWVSVEDLDEKNCHPIIWPAVSPFSSWRR